MHMIVPDHQVDVWCAFLDEGEAPDLGQLHQSVLSSDEALRYARFHFDKDRQQFLLTRALIRDVLARYVGTEPSALVFTQNEYGKPVLAEPITCSVAFSLSHTQGLSVCAVAWNRMIGVDVERLDRTNCHPEIATRFFAPTEAAYLGRLEGEQRRLEFLRLWTLKEAFVKARGKGLSIPLNSFTIGCSPGEPARVSLQDGDQGHESDWRLLQIRLGRSFQIAVVMEVPEQQNLQVRFSKLVPLTGQETSLLLEPSTLNEWTLSADASSRTRRG